MNVTRSNLLRETGEFVVNIPIAKLCAKPTTRGAASGRDHDKFHETGLTMGRSETVKAPIIIECPINIECKVEREIELGSHSLFLARITNVQVSADLIDDKGTLNAEKAAIVGYAHGHYQPERAWPLRLQREKELKSTNFLIIGAGPAGLMAAIRAADLGPGNDSRVDAETGANLAFLGKGRGNLTNTDPFNTFLKHFNNEGRFLKSAFKAFSHRPRRIFQ